MSLKGFKNSPKWKEISSLGLNEPLQVNFSSSFLLFIPLAQNSCKNKTLHPDPITVLREYQKPFKEAKMFSYY